MINGFVLVRKPLEIEIMPGRKLPPVDGRLYNGLDRLAWSDLKALYYEEKLAFENRLVLKKIMDSSNLYPFIEISDNLEDCMKLLSTGDLHLQNELIVVNIEMESGISNDIPFSGGINWLGYDIVSSSWSLLKHGVFENRQLSLLANSPLNRYGLFDNLSNIDKFQSEYDRLAKHNLVDPLDENSVKLAYVKVGIPLNIPVEASYI